MNFVNNTAISGGATAFKRQKHTIGSLEKNTEVYFSNNYAHYFGIVFFILDDNSCKLPFKMLSAAIECSLLLYNLLSNSFTNNTAQEGEVLVYIQPLESCTVYKALLGASNLSLISSKCMLVHFCKDGEPD